MPAGDAGGTASCDVRRNMMTMTDTRIEQACAIPLLRQPFLFLRHGQTESNRRKVIGGSTDDPLTEEGMAQARAAAAPAATSMSAPTRPLMRPSGPLGICPEMNSRLPDRTKGT